MDKNYLTAKQGKTHKKKCFLLAGSLRGGGDEPPEPLSKKIHFFHKRKKWMKNHEPLRSRGLGGLPRP